MYNDNDRSAYEYHYNYRGDSEGFQPAQPPMELHVRGAADYVGVGGDIAVGGEDKAAAGAGGLHRLAEEVVARQSGGVDAHAAVHVAVVELRERRHGRAGHP